MDQDNFLARWLEGTLSDEELQEFEKTEAYESYAKIIDHSDRLTPPEYSNVREFIALRKKLPEKESATKVIKLDPITLFFRIAAVFIIAFGLYYFIDQRDTHINTSIAEHRNTFLPDHSEVALNAESSIEFNKNSWSRRRAVKLEGEAFFKVAKGKKFDVITSNGVISVVGTEFNVKNRNGYFEVVCYEGIVRVMHLNMEKTLTIGDGFKIFNGNVIEENDISGNIPSWIENESTFNSIPLEYVLNELKRQYDITIDLKDIDTSVLFTGGFTHNNIDIALQSICIPLQIKYVVNDDKVKLHADKP